MLEPNQTLGSYRVVDFLGAGGMGSVYEVTHLSMGTRHAMKLLADQYVRNPAVRERFRREAQLMFKLGAHPHVLRATDMVETERQVALIIDLVDGGDLGQALDARPGPLPWEEAWRILKPVVSAVAFAHERRIVHRDLKPENVLLRKDGTWPGVPLVADFGIAKVLGSQSATRTQASMGTAGYASPEQFRNAKEVGPEADVWALGMLTYRLVMGELPVDPEDNLALVKLHEGMTQAPYLTGVPEAVARAVSAALNPDPGQRPRDAGVFGKLLEGESTDWVPAPSQPGPASGAPDARSPRTGLASPAASGTSPGVGPASGPAPAPKRGLWLGVCGAVLAAGAIGFGLSRGAAPSSPIAAGGRAGAEARGAAALGVPWGEESVPESTRGSVTVVVDSAKDNGSGWDALGGLPDLALCYTGDEGKTCIPGGKSSVTPGEPAFCQNSLTCVFALEVRGPEVLVEIIDVDLAENDPVGAGLCKVGGICRIGSATVTFR
jgi:hypothetical protein